METNTKPMRFGTVLLGLLFFCNPNFAAIDVLPDCIGCLLICLGLTRVALLYPFVGEIRKTFLKLAGVDAVKNLLLFAVMGLGSGTAEQPTALLIIAFAAAVVELIFLLPALRGLFDVFFTLASRYDCPELYANPYGGLSRTDSLARLSMIFVVVREVVCLLPELTALTTSSFSDSEWDRLYEYIGIMRLLACLLVALFGLYWLVRLVLYFRRLHRQQGMLLALGESYSAYMVAHPGVAIKRRYFAAFLAIGAGALMLTDFYLDFENVIPDPVAGTLLCLGVLFMGVSPALQVSTLLLSGAYIAVSHISSGLSYSFALEFSASALGKNREADLAYAEMWIWSAVEFALFLALLICLMLLIRAVVYRWAGYRAEQYSAFEKRNHRDMLSYFDGQLLLCGVLGFLSALVSFLFDYIQTPSGKGIYHFLDYLWMFDFGFAILFSVTLCVTLTRIYLEIKNRFRYD